MSEKPNKNIVLLITTVISFMTPFMGSSINIALPSIGKEFLLNTVYLNWIATSFLLTTAALLLPAGRLADIYGRIKLFKTGTIVFSVGTLLCGLSFSGELLIAARVLQGIGSSMIFSTSTAILVSVFPPEERGKVLGINTTAVYTGLSIGPFIGGMLTQTFGWRSIFFLTFIFGVLALALIYTKLKMEWIEAYGEKFDLKGSVIYGFVLIAVMYGFSSLPQITGIILTGCGIIAFYFFLRYELRIKNPVLNISLFKMNKAFAFSNLAALINYSATFAVSFLLSFYLQYIKGLTPRAAGTVLIAQPIIMAIFSPLSGKLSDKIEPNIVSSIGMAITTIGLIILVFLSSETSLVFIVVSLVFLGFGFALFSSPNANAIMSSVEKKYYGVAASTQSTMRLTGQMLSMGIAMVIFSVFIGKTVITPDKHEALLNSIRIAFIVFSILCFAGIFASLSRGKIHS